MTKSITCLFLGSGASYALAGIPMQRDFLCSLLTGERPHWIDECGLEIGGSQLSRWMLEVGDIELCMSHLHNLAYTDPDDLETKLQATQAIVNFRAAVADYLNNKHRGMDLCMDKPIHKRFLEFMKRVRDEGNGPVILTTNYDLVLEQMLRKHDWSYHYPDVSTTSNNDQRMQIYKLHGSINWLEKRWFQNGNLRSLGDLGQERKADVPDDLLLSEAKKEGWAYLFTGSEYTINGNMYKTYNPVLIPFVFQKDEWLGDNGGWKNIFPNHWNSAKEFLSKNELRHICFIGYSLPPADHHIMSWLLNILGTAKHKHPQITIVRKGSDSPTLLEKALKPFVESNKESKVYECGLENFLDGHVKP